MSACDVLAGVHGADASIPAPGLGLTPPGVVSLGGPLIACRWYAAACGTMKVHYDRYNVVANIELTISYFMCQVFECARGVR